jgi:predicted nucleotidyltransferase
LIDKYNIPKNKVLIFGSSLLAVHGLRPNKDLDIAVTKDVFNSLSSKFTIGIASSGEKFLTDKDHNIEIYYSLGVPELSFNELFKRADNIDDYLFLSIPDMIAWKKKMGRPKDLEDIKLITHLI